MKITHEIVFRENPVSERKLDLIMTALTHLPERIKQMLPEIAEFVAALETNTSAVQSMNTAFGLLQTQIAALREQILADLANSDLNPEDAAAMRASLDKFKANTDEIINAAAANTPTS